MTPAPKARAVVVHSSDELYGADRMLLHVVAVLRDLDVDLEVWLPSDVEHGSHPLCERLSQEGHRWRHQHLPILRRSAIRPRLLPALLRDIVRTGHRLRRERPDLVYLASSACLLVAPLARLAGTGRCVVHIQERWEGSTTRVLGWLARWTSLRIAISNYVADATGLVDRPPVVVLNAVDDAAARVPTPLHRDDGPLSFVVASRWNRWKGHRTLLAAWDRAGCPGTLVVLGGPPPTGDAVDVPRLVAEISDPSSVEVVGEVADAAPFIAAADVMILPSDEPEPFGLVVIEAFSLGRPVVASRAGGPLEIIEDGVSGWLFPARDVDGLAEILSSLERSRVRKAGVEARRAYDTGYRPDRYRAEIAELLSAELSGHERPDGQP